MSEEGTTRWDQRHKVGNGGCEQEARLRKKHPQGILESDKRPRVSKADDDGSDVPTEYTIQSSFSCSCDSPQIHFPPSPSAPMRSSSCGQENAGRKKSPEGDVVRRP